MATTLKRKQISVLTMSTIAFAVNFAVWVMFSVIGIKIKAELNLSETEFGLMVATPILTGSLVRLPLGILTDRYGGRIIFFIQMLLVAIPTWMLSYATEYWQYLVLGLFVGLAGGSFAVGIAYTSAWFSKERQGTAMGIFGAGNAGSSLTKFIAPLIIGAFGMWQMVPKVYAVALVAMAVLFWLFTYTDPLHEPGAQENRQRPTLAQQLMPLIDPRVWRFGLAYSFMFGAFVALALWLPKYYVGEYGLPLATAAFLTIFFDLPSGAIRALGGWASDRWGGSTVTWWVLWISLVCLFLLSYPPTTMIVHGIEGDVSISLSTGIVLFTILVFLVGLAQGFGKASVYRSLADHYPTQMGVVGGIVGLIGGLGGFVLPIMFGVAADAIGVRTSCFMLMFLLVVVTMLWTWVAERDEREEILERHAEVRAEMVSADLIEPRRRRRWLADWRPDDPEFWEKTGRRVANRNLWLSMCALLMAFAVWVVWSVIVVKLPLVGFQFSANQLFWLAALPGLSGVVFRVLYSFMVPIFGGRNWTVFSTALLLLPSLWIGVAVQNPHTQYAVFVVIALLCGLGAGNFASSMANISFFYPQRLQGTALGLNAGVGNLGVGLTQLIAPIAIYGGALLILGGDAQTLREADGSATRIWLQNAGFIWVPFIIAAALAAYFGMDNIETVKAGFADQIAIFKHKHQWLMSWLYTGTFGSFIGLAVSFPMLVNTEFPSVDAFKFAFIGPLLAALVRPFGGWLADRQGGAHITFWCFVVMTLAPVMAMLCLPSADGGGSMIGFVLAFLVLFLAAGVGNGSTFRMIPTLFRTLREREVRNPKDVGALEQARRAATTEAAATLGLSSALGTLGGFFIPIAYGTSIGLTGSFQAALLFFSLFYISCLWITWHWYASKQAEVPC